MRARQEAVTAFLARLGVAPAEALAVGWATVDIERAATELAPGDELVPLGDEALLGARAVRIAAGVEPALVLLEPITEGRLAATLARHGEGPAAVWLVPGAAAARRPPLPSATPIPTAAPFTASRAAGGPFGAERLVLGRPVNGPHVLVLEERPGTIRP